MDHLNALIREGQDTNVTLVEAARSLNATIRAVDSVLATLRSVTPTAETTPVHREIVAEFSERLVELQRQSIALSAQRQSLRLQISEIIRRASEQDMSVRLEGERIENERRAFDEKARACGMMAISELDKVVFDIGGKRFSIGKSYLTWAAGLLREMFSGELGPIAGEDGAFFLDRPPQAYKYIFDYLRNGPESFTRPTHPEVCELVLKEAEFLRLEGLRNMIASSPMTRRHENVPCPLQPFRNCYYIHEAEWDERKLGYFCPDCGESFIIMRPTGDNGAGMRPT